MSTFPKTGGCLCGAVRYELARDPDSMGLCYCRSCQKATSSSCLNFLWGPVDAVTVTGPLTWHESPGGSGQPVHRGFCAQCGTWIIGKPTIAEDMCTITAGTLDDTSYFKPVVAIWTDDKPEWVKLDSDMHQFPQNPEH